MGPKVLLFVNMSHPLTFKVNSKSSRFTCIFDVNKGCLVGPSGDCFKKGRLWSTVKNTAQYYVLCIFGTILTAFVSYDRRHLIFNRNNTQISLYVERTIHL